MSIHGFETDLVASTSLNITTRSHQDRRSQTCGMVPILRSVWSAKLTIAIDVEHAEGLLEVSDFLLA